MARCQPQPCPHTHASRLWPVLLSCLVMTCVSSCSLYTAGRTLLEQPLEVIECLPECPSATETVWLRHSSGALATCGPYPHALYSSMAAGYRLERQQCVTRYLQQGYVRLARTAGADNR